MRDETRKQRNIVRGRERDKKERQRREREQR